MALRDRLNIFIPKDTAITTSKDYGDTIKLGNKVDFNANNKLYLEGIFTADFDTAAADVLELKLMGSADNATYTEVDSVIFKGTEGKYRLPKDGDSFSIPFSPAYGVQYLKITANCSKSSDGSAANFSTGKAHVYFTID